MHNRDGCCGERLSDITVSIEDQEGNIVYASEFLNPANALDAPETITLTLPELILGSRVLVNRTPNGGGANGNVLSLGEVEIQGCAAN